MSDVEKAGYVTDAHAEKIEYVNEIPADSEDESPNELHTVDKGYTHIIVELPEAEAKRAIRKVDFRLVPLLALLYLVAFIDRSNIGNAKIAGLAKDLKLHGLEYNIAVTCFFCSYAIFEVPCNIILKMMRPSRWIALIMFCWGTVMTLMSLISNKHGLYAARFCLGIAEVSVVAWMSFTIVLDY